MTRWLPLAGLLAGGLVGMIALPAGAGACRTAAPAYGSGRGYGHHHAAIEELVILFQHAPVVTVPVAATPAAGGVPAALVVPPAAPPPPAPTPPPGPPPVRRAGPPLIRRAGSPAPAAPGYVAVYRQHCLACHQAGKRTSGGVAIFDAAGAFAPNRPLDVLAAAVESGAMPPPGKGRLTEQEKGAVRAAR